MAYKTVTPISYIIQRKAQLKVEPNVTTPDFAFCFYAVYVQLLLLFSRRFLFIDTTCFGLTGHLQVYRLLWLGNLLLTATVFCFTYVVASDYFWLCD
jgi:hypothetical protein